MDLIYSSIVPLIVGWSADFFLGDPSQLPHLVVGFGCVISKGEKAFNKGVRKRLKGGLFALSLIVATYLITFFLLKALRPMHPILGVTFSAIGVFYCLAGTTLVREVRNVFLATDRSLAEGRKQVGRIVGRDTSELSIQEIRTAALETASENLSDGVVAPLFWFLLLGVPGMLAYKMINTLDSMIGYKNERYGEFGFIAARVDDIANYVPARLTAVLMILVSGKLNLFSFVRKYGKCHSSPNAGYPEAALAGILGCRFGGAHIYFGELVDKPYIGETEKELTFEDMEEALSINRKTEVGIIVLTIALRCLFYIIFI